MPGRNQVCLGQIGAPHGVAGQVRLRSFTADPGAIAGYGALQTEDGRTLRLTSLRPAGAHFVAGFAGVCDRDAAAGLANARLYVPRERLPRIEAPDEYYHADLIGLDAVDRAGTAHGTVVAIHNFGAGDLIEVRLAQGGRTEMLPFDADHVPQVDLANKRIVISPPAATAERPGRPRARR